MPGEGAAPSLAGLRVLVTRPRHQAQPLCEAINRAGGEALAAPAVEITEPSDPGSARALAARLDRFDMAVFVSANAVDRACGLVGRGGRWPPALKLAAVGRGSAAALRRCGLEPDICPARDFSSDGLLALDEMHQVDGRRIVIFRGEGGREVLADTLRARGAEVEYAEVYRRSLPAGGARELRSIAATQPVDVIVVTSNEGLRNLYTMAGEEARDWLLTKQLVVISRRTAELAVALGFHSSAWCAEEASDAGLVEAIGRGRDSGQNRTGDRGNAD